MILKKIKKAIRKSLPLILLASILCNLGYAAIQPDYTPRQLKWLKHLASQNNTHAMLQLTNYYYARKEYKKALVYIYKGQKLHNPALITSLGLFYYKGLGGLNKNYGKAKTFFKVGLNANIPAAYNMMGNIYSLGLGTPANIPQSIKYYEKAISLGANGARYNLAKTLEFYDPKLAYKQLMFLSKHSSQNNIKFQAMNELAYFNLSGVSTKKNLVEAYKWFYIAATHNNVHAIKALKLFSNEFTPSQKSEGKKLAEEYEKQHDLH